MIDGYLTPLQAFKAAKDLHEERRWRVLIYLEHAGRGGMSYTGDDDRRAGRTATVSLDPVEHGPSLDELVSMRDRALELGWRVELGSSGFDVLGPAA